jgi:hypothetical protein
VTLNDLAVWATLGAFIVPLISLAFSARRWLAIRDAELKAARFQTYHGLIHSISSGTNERGVMKLTSQIAYIYELRNFPEYAHLTKSVLSLLRNEWMEREADQMKVELVKAVDETLAHVQRAT